MWRRMPDRTVQTIDRMWVSFRKITRWNIENTRLFYSLTALYGKCSFRLEVRRWTEWDWCVCGPHRETGWLCCHTRTNFPMQFKGANLTADSLLADIVMWIRLAQKSTSCNRYLIRWQLLLWGFNERHKLHRREGWVWLKGAEVSEWCLKMVLTERQFICVSLPFCRYVIIRDKSQNRQRFHL